MKQVNQHNKIQNLFIKENVDAILISSLPNIIYITQFNHFSNHEREGFLLLTKTKNYIITDARYSHAVHKKLPQFTLLEISNTHPFEKILQKIIKQENITTLGIEEHDISVREHKTIQKIIPQTKHVSFANIRIQKTTDEIKRIQKACKLADNAFAFILKKIKLGITEKQLAFFLETYIRKHGAEPSFETIIAFEENAAIPHHKTGNRKLNNNEFILMDFGVKYNNYCSDMTRTIHFGKATSEKKKTYQTVLDAQQKTIHTIQHSCRDAKSCVSTTKHAKSCIFTCKEIDAIAREHIINKGYPSIPHALGHGIGLQVHELPRLSPSSKNVLEEGMVFSIEPGIYLNDKYGVRIEDLFTIKKGKLIQLTNAPKQFIEI